MLLIVVGIDMFILLYYREQRGKPKWMCCPKVCMCTYKCAFSVPSYKNSSNVKVGVEIFVLCCVCLMAVCVYLSVWERRERKDSERERERERCFPTIKIGMGSAQVDFPWYFQLQFQCLLLLRKKCLSYMVPAAPWYPWHFFNFRGKNKSLKVFENGHE